MKKPPLHSVSLEDVLEKEFAQVETARALRLGPNPQRARADTSLVGLAFSGGGIRSATFNLGVLQALAKARLLRIFDYVSTVSGGGYIGSWLMAWMHHQKIGVTQVEELLSAQAQSPSKSVERPEVRFLRNYSNYLTPRKGLLGADFWAFTASYLRNTFLNQLILVLALLSLLLLPRAIVTLLHLLEMLELYCQQQDSDFLQDYLYAQYFALALGIFFGVVGVAFMGLNLMAIGPGDDRRYRWFTKQKAVQGLIVVPLFLAAGFVSYGLGHFFIDYHVLAHPYTRLPLLGVILYFGQWAFAFLVRGVASLFKRPTNTAPRNTTLRGPAIGLVLATSIVTGALAGFLFLPFSRLLISSEGGSERVLSNWHVLAFGTPAFVLIMLSAGVLHIGLMGRGMRDAHREWWARLGGWLLIYSFLWLFLFLIAIYFPYGLGRLLDHYHGKAFTWTGALTWIASTAYGVFFGKSAATRESLPDTPLKKKLMGYLARLAPYVFILGFLMVLSLLAAKIANTLAKGTRSILLLPHESAFYVWVPVVCIVFFLAALLLSWRVDVNEFSVHHLYRNRLVRGYLGASVANRNEQPFTGFSDADDFPLAALQIPEGAADKKYGRPLPIINASLNVVRGKELALQTRKARAFAFTPLFSGYTRPIAGTTDVQSAFAPTCTCGADRHDRGGVSLGTALAISGAAASPNMGSYSAPDLAFLMTLFDVRLGWWMANPKEKCWRRGSPYLGFYWLLCELLGATNDDSDYVYLSDGGHFENLAIYELVRRGCKLIVACDASCDSAYGCSDLHNAMEKCRADFGVEIEMTADEIGKIKPAGAPPRATAHYAVGTIHYTPGNPAGDGVLIYLKPALVAKDAADVLGYASTNPDFPHDSTANQWFDESHFENYRAMGEATGAAALATIQKEIRPLFP